MTDYEKITVIMHEYDTLRDEIVQRNNSVQQQIYIGVAVLIGIITIFMTLKTNSLQKGFLIVFLAVAVLVFSYAMWTAYRDIHLDVRRIREIEDDVNRRAGEELLQWEKYWGGVSTGFFTRSAAPRPHPPSTATKAEPQPQTAMPKAHS